MSAPEDALRQPPASDAERLAAQEILKKKKQDELRLKAAKVIGNFGNVTLYSGKLDPHSTNVKGVIVSLTSQQRTTKQGPRAGSTFPSHEAQVIVCDIEAKVQEVLQSASLRSYMSADAATGQIHFKKTGYLTGDIAQPFEWRTTPVFDSEREVYTILTKFTIKSNLKPQEIIDLNEAHKKEMDDYAIKKAQEVAAAATIPPTGVEGQAVPPIPSAPPPTVQLVDAGKYLDLPDTVNSLKSGQIVYVTLKNPPDQQKLGIGSLVELPGFHLSCYLTKPDRNPDFYDDFGRGCSVKYQASSIIPAFDPRNQLAWGERLRAVFDPMSSDWRHHTSMSTYVLDVSPHVAAIDIDALIQVDGPRRIVAFNSEYKRMGLNGETTIDDPLTFSWKNKTKGDKPEACYPVVAMVEEVFKVVTGDEVDIESRPTTVRATLYAEHCRESGIAELNSWINVNTTSPLDVRVVARLKREKNEELIIPGPDVMGINVAPVLVEFRTKERVMEEGIPITAQFIRSSIFAKQVPPLNPAMMMQDLGTDQKTEGTTSVPVKIQNISNERRGKIDLYNISEAQGNIEHLFDPANGWLFAALPVFVRDQWKDLPHDERASYVEMMSQLHTIKDPAEGVRAFEKYLTEFRNLKNSFFQKPRDIQFILWAYKPPLNVIPSAAATAPKITSSVAVTPIALDTASAALPPPPSTGATTSTTHPVVLPPPPPSSPPHPAPPSSPSTTKRARESSADDEAKDLEEKVDAMDLDHDERGQGGDGDDSDEHIQPPKKRARAH